MNDDTPVQVQSDAPAQADTAPVPNIEADVQANNETPEVAAAQEATVNTTDTVEETKLYAGKYKSVEEMEKAYTELQGKFTNTASEKAELSRILAEAFASEPVVPTPVQSNNYDDYQEEIPSAPQDTSVNRDIAVMKFVMGNPDADGKAILDIINTDPFVKDLPSYEAKLKYAHALSRNTAAPKVVEEARKQAVTETQVRIAEKQAAQVEPASTQSPPTQEEPLTRGQLRQALKDENGFNALLKKRDGFKPFVS